jgi:glyoxylase-like metal-dependent hydrolase (beta-lactamase superfamily II)
VTYTGEVSPGGPADTREAGDLVITKVAVDPEMSNNCYLLRCTATGEQVLIDAAAEPDTLLPLIGDAGLTAVVTTHQHWDHHRALADVVAATGAEVIAGAPDADAITEQTDVPVTRRVEDGDTIPVGSCSVRVIRLTGHTPGSIALLHEDPAGHPHLFTGDSLFPGGPGRTTHSDDFNQLMADLRAKVFGPLPDETWFYPGHGNDSTLGAERGSLNAWQERGW